MDELQELLNVLKILFKQRDELLPEIEKLPKEHLDLISKFKLISETIAQLQPQFDALIQKVPHKK